MALSSVVAFMTAGIGTDRHARAPAHLRVDGRVFRSEHGRFGWRGISAFRLVEMVARRREGEAIAFLDWASKQELTVVRVFVMARHLFSLTPAEGLAALPRLLELANARGLHVEVVAFADTAQIRTDLDVHLKAVAAIVARHPNAILEIANEPGHATQDVRLHNPAFVKRLAALVPEPVPIALGSAEYSADYASGDYVTYHFPRKTGWGHVFDLARGAALIEHWRKPVVSDEPIGAAAKTVDGRRDSDPRHFRGAAALTRLTGMGATFHYEGGLQARIPSGRELECFVAWRAGLGMVDGLPEDGAFLEGSAVGAIGDVSGAGAAFARVFELENEAWLLLLDTSPRVSVGWKQGWSETGRNTGDGVALLRARR
jgi:hypothetical protein